jgi:hypothetical protein
MASESRPPTPEDVAPLRRYLDECALSGCPLEVQLQTTRLLVACALGSYWTRFGPEYAGELLSLSARVPQFHRWLDDLIAASYPPAPAVASDAPSTGESFVVVVEGGNGSARPSLLPVEGGVRHLRLDDTHVLVIPAAPDGRAVAGRAVRRSRAAGRRCAVAHARTGDDVRAAYVAATALLRGPAGDAIDGDLAVDDALPEALLLAGGEVASRLAGCVAPLGPYPELVRTLAVYLECDLDRTQAAERLFLHRRTVTQRLHRIGELTGYDPRTTRGIQVLGLALTASRLGPRADPPHPENLDPGTTAIATVP